VGGGLTIQMHPALFFGLILCPPPFPNKLPSCFWELETQTCCAVCLLHT
jgi:hypothetical protein